MNAAPPDPVAAKSKLFKLTRKRLEKYATLVPKLLINDDPETVHDLRVRSRRLQQALRIIARKPNSKKVKRLVAQLRHVRRTLSPCRDCDVNIAIVKSKREIDGSGSVHKAWALIQKELQPQRQALFQQVRRDLGGIKLIKFIARAHKLTLDVERNFNPVEEISRAMAKSMEGWEESLAALQQQPEAAALHALRIAGKKVRYRAELLSDLGQGQVRPLVRSLKAIQTNLGEWHDRTVLQNHIDEFIRRPGFLTDHPDSGRILLVELEKERLRNDSVVASALQNAAKVQQTWASWRGGATVK